MFPKSAKRFDYGKEGIELDLPGPGAYDVKTGMLSDDPLKHFGFIDKAKRFRTVKQEEKLGDEENINPEENIKTVPKPLVSKSLRSEKDELNKLKADLERWQDSYKRLQMSHEKDIAILEEKIFKNETQLQTVLKEKTLFMSTASSKDREITELIHKETRLRVNLEKSEKQVAVLQDKINQMNQFQKKLEDAEKVNIRLRSLVEKKANEENIQKEKEQLEKRVTILQKEIESIKIENQSLQTSANSARNNLQEARNDFEKNANAWKTQLAKKDAALESQKISSSLSISEIQSQLTLVQEKFESMRTKMDRQLADQHEQLNNLKSENIKLESQLEELKSQSSEELAQLQDRFDMLFDEKQDLDSQLLSLTEQINALNQKNRELISEHDTVINEVRESLRESQLQSQETKNALDDCEKRYAELQKKYGTEMVLVTESLTQLESEKNKDSLYFETMIRKFEETIMMSITTFAGAHDLDAPNKEGILDIFPSLLISYSSSIVARTESFKLRISQFKEEIEALNLKLRSKDEASKKIQESHDIAISEMEDRINLKINELEELIENKSTLESIVTELEVGNLELKQEIRSQSIKIDQVNAEREALTEELKSKELQLNELFQGSTNERQQFLDRITRLTEELGTINSKLISTELKLSESVNANNDNRIKFEQVTASLEQERSRNSILSTGKEDLTKINSELVQEVNKLESAIAVLDESLDNCRFEAQTLTEALSQKESLIAKLEMDLKTVNANFFESNTKTDFLTSQIEDLNSQLEFSREDGQTMELELEQTRDQIRNLEIDLKKLNISSSEFKANIEALTFELEEKKIELVEAKSLSNNTKSELLEQISRLEESVRIDSEKLVELQAHFGSQESQFSTEKNRLQDIIQKQSDSLQNLELAIVEKDGEIEALNESLEMSDITLRRSTEEHILQLKGLKDEFDSEKIEMRFTTENLQIELNAAMQSIESLKMEKNALVNNISRLKAEMEEFQTNNKTEIQKFEQERDHLQEQVSCLETSLEFKVQTIDKQNSELKIAEKNLLNLQESMSEMEKAYINQLDELSHLKFESETTLKQQITENKAEIINKTEKINHLEQIIQEQDLELDQLSNDSKFLSEENTRLEIQRKELLLAQADFDADITALKASITVQTDSNRQIIQELTKKIEDMSEDLQSSKNKIAEYEIELNNALDAKRQCDENYAILEKKTSEFCAAKAREKASSELMMTSMKSDFDARLATANQTRQQAENALSRMEIMHANELAGRTLQCKYLEDKLHERTLEVQSIRDNLATDDKRKVELRLLRAAEDDTSKKLAKLTKENEELKRRTASKNISGDKLTHDLQLQLQDLKGKYHDVVKAKEALAKSNDDKITELTKKISIMEAKDKIASEELEKVADLNGEVYGHHNAKQKIKHVHQIKSENVTLRQEKTSLEKMNSEYRRKIHDLERELDSAKVDDKLFGGKRVPRLARHISSIMQPSNFDNISSGDGSFFVTLDENKEN